MLCAIMSIVSEPFTFPGNMPKPTPEGRVEAKRLLEKAKVESNPWAYAAGIFRNNSSFDEWVEIMRKNRRKADEDPNYTFSEAAIRRYNGLLVMKLIVGRMDLRIAAVALEEDAVVITRNLRDLERMPGLACENWAD